MIRPDDFLSEAAERGFRLYTGVPCSYLKPFINGVIDSDRLRYVGAVNEGDAVAIAAGSELGGQRAVALFQNSGLGNAVNPLTSLAQTFRIPMLLVTSWRGDPDAEPEEPQHRLMGAITPRLLELMEIPWELFPTRPNAVPAALDRALGHMEEHGTPYALIMRAGTAEPSELRSQPRVRRPELVQEDLMSDPVATRMDMLRAARGALAPDDVTIATTGYTGRQLYACGDDPRQFYMVGSMGCAAALGLGLALARPDRRAVVLDGDGALLMRLGALATIGYERPSNLVHVVLDNGVHESTGGQATVSRSISFRAIAAACGYPRTRTAHTPDELAGALDEPDEPGEGPLFVHALVRPGLATRPPRPHVSPPEVAERLRRHLAGGA